MEAILLIGVQGAGKSTFYARRFADTHLRLNRDMVKTEHRLDSLFHAALAVKQAFVLDNTNTLRRTRERWIASSKAAGFRVVGYWFDVPLADALARNAAREGKQRIPDTAIRRLMREFEPPTNDEGFDAIHRVQLVELDFVVDPLDCRDG